MRSAWLLVAAALLAAGCTLPEPGPTPSPTPVPPRELAVAVADQLSDDPVVDAQLTVEGVEGVRFTDATGAADVTAFIGSDVTVDAPGYDPAQAVVPETGNLAIALRPNVLTGTVVGTDGEPVTGVRVFVDGTENSVETDADGAYEIAGVPADGLLVYKAAGFAIAEQAVADLESTVADVSLEPFVARALYAPAGIFEAPGRLEAMLDLIDRTEINAMVIDVKETDGQLFYATDLPAAVEMGAVREVPILNLEELLPMLEERGIYTIARMVVSKDNTVAEARPELAVENIVTGGPWTDRLGGAWLDPFKPGVWEYVLAVATDLADKGFDEVQLDYVRFLSDGPYEEASTVLPNYQSHRLPAMRRLFRMAEEAFDHRRAFLGADVFPISFILADDQGIGQRADVVMPYVDYVCPMIYPSHYGAGMFGYEVPNDYPYEVTAGTLEVMLADAEEIPVVIRPWIQDFGYGPYPPYSAAQVRAQMDAGYDLGVQGWMIWNPSADFTEAALGPPEDAAAAEE